MARQPTAHQRAIAGDVVEGPSLLAPPVQWASDLGDGSELRSWLLQRINIDAMRIWVEPQARHAFDHLMNELVNRVQRLAESYAEGGLLSRKKVILRLDQTAAAGRARGKQVKARVAGRRAGLASKANDLKRKNPRMSEQRIAEFLGVDRKTLRAALGKSR